MTKYLIDSDVLITAKNRHYGFDICPAFWEWLEQQNALGVIASVEKIFNEVGGGEDALSAWANTLGQTFFMPPDEKVNQAFGTVTQWVTGQSYKPSAVSEFLSGADYYLVTHAKAYGCAVVTHEVPSDTVNKVKIPNACIGLGIRCFTPFEMLRLEQARFVLPRAHTPK